MISTKATIKNVNLRAENSDDGKIGAFDVSIEVPYTADMHEYLTRQKAVTIEKLEKMGIASAKLNSEHDNLILHFEKFSSELAKINNPSIEFDTNNKCKLRVQAYLNDAHGMAEAINIHTGELVFLEIDDDSITITKAQGDLIDSKDDDDGDDSEVHVKGKDPVLDDDGKTELHVDGDDGANIDEVEIERRKKEKAAILKQTKRDKKMSDEDRAQEDIKRMVLDLSKVVMGQGDAHDYGQLAEKVSNNRKLTANQTDLLIELHSRYKAIKRA